MLRCFSDAIISSIVPADRNGDYQMNDIPTTHPKRKSSLETTVYVFWGNNHTLDGDGYQDHLLPACMDDICQKSAIYLEKPGEAEWIPILTVFQEFQDVEKMNTMWGFDGQQAFLLENVPCGNISCREAGCMFCVHRDLSDLASIPGAVVATFFDICEDAGAMEVSFVDHFISKWQYKDWK